MLAKASQAEKRVTPDLQGLANQQGMKMEGLDFRLKTEDSLIRKLGDTPADQVGDALRYTMVSGADDLAGNAASTLRTLQDKGYEVVKVKNTFLPDAPYKGLNTQLRSPDGQLFELQFHTPQSFDVKQNLTHKLYEEFRVLAEGDPRRAEIAGKLIDISRAIPEPKGLADTLRSFFK